MSSNSPSSGVSAGNASENSEVKRDPRVLAHSAFPWHFHTNCLEIFLSHLLALRRRTSLNNRTVFNISLAEVTTDLYEE